MNYKKIIMVNKGELELIHSEIPDMEIGPNRCAVDVNWNSIGLSNSISFNYL
jgi:hypothetical protein